MAFWAGLWHSRRCVSLPLASLLAVWLLGPGPGEPDSGLAVTSAVVEAEAFERGLAARVGEDLADWGVEVADVGEANAVEVTLRRPDGSVETRRFELSPGDPEATSRELAASVALIIDEYEPPAEPADEPDPPPPEPPARRGFVAIHGRVGLGSPTDLDAGGGLLGGAWLVREHLQPRFGVSWSISTRGPLTLQALRFGPELGAGLPVADARLWLGGKVAARAVAVWAAASQTDSTWVFSPAGGPLMQVRWSRVFVELSADAELHLRPVAARGDGRSLRWGILRFAAAAGFGLRF